MFCDILSIKSLQVKINSNKYQYINKGLSVGPTFKIRTQVRQFNYQNRHIFHDPTSYA